MTYCLLCIIIITKLEPFTVDTAPFYMQNESYQVKWYKDCQLVKSSEKQGSSETFIDRYEVSAEAIRQNYRANLCFFFSFFKCFNTLYTLYASQHNNYSIHVLTHLFYHSI